MPDTVIGNRDPLRHVTETKTVGWEKTCNCDTTEVEPCTVLDPFAGSGTTLAISKEYGRNGVAIELNIEYTSMLSKRVADKQTLFN